MAVFNSLILSLEVIMHVANGGGLQEHSVGEDYPFMVVGTIKFEGKYPHLEEVTQYYVMDAETGQQYRHANGTNYNNSSTAHGVAAALKVIKGA